MCVKCLKLGLYKGLLKIMGQSNPTYYIIAVQPVEENQSCACFILLRTCFILALQAIYITPKINLVVGQTPSGVSVNAKEQLAPRRYLVNLLQVSFRLAQVQRKRGNRRHFALRCLVLRKGELTPLLLRRRAGRGQAAGCGCWAALACC